MDDLNAPLGQNKTRKPPRRFPSLLPQLIAGALSLSLALFAGWAMLVSDRSGGEPMAVHRLDSSMERPGANQQGAAAKAAAPENPLGAQRAASLLPAGAKTVTIIDGSSGKREDVVLPNAGVIPAAEPPRAAN